MSPIPKRPLAALGALLLAVSLAACSNSASPASGSPAAPAASLPSASPTASSEALDMLEKAAQAAEGLSTYAYTLQLSQQLSGGAAEASDLKVDNEGKVECSPLRVDQNVTSDMDGAKSSLRAILEPGAYYVYDPELTEWGKLAPDQADEVVKTLSDYQTNPAQAMREISKLGSGLVLTRKGEQDVLRYEGSGPEAKAFLNRVLEGTLDLGSLDAKVRESVAVQSLKVSVTLDDAKRMPLAYSIESEMTIDYEAGKPSTLRQTLSGTYDKLNAVTPIVVPDAAKQAPVLDPPIDDPAADEGNLGTLDDLEDPSLLNP
ncbi:DUF6612 family protein [Cohnella nanjingensis]|uniref:LppX_LprAFG lipoprotein n=1 Tax=Cohnella nanjingensis TaxID=1387779 RepID=A0A7X0RPM4_9BACL|nr:DUF6612 family protein [Cohnella nanjingensis]MBB6669919.1 hypothetical protein [Cohnella nanjingensis]